MGLKIFVLIKGFPKAVNNNGAVSPITRAMLRITPVIIPAKPVGTIIFKMFYSTEPQAQAKLLLMIPAKVLKFLL